MEILPWGQKFPSDTAFAWLMSPGRTVFGSFQSVDPIFVGTFFPGKIDSLFILWVGKDQIRASAGIDGNFPRRWQEICY